MSLNAALLRSSFEQIAAREPLITKRFYAHLFTKYPQAKPLFGRNSAEAQQEMLQSALVSVIEHLEDSTWLTQNLAALGAKHVDYGVTREMFDWVGDALLTTLAEILGEGWTQDVHEAWVAAYGAICSLMFVGMEPSAA